MEEKILKEIQEIKKELQDIRSILEPKNINATIIVNNQKQLDVEEITKTISTSFLEPRHLPNRASIIPL